jgi:hypothetical protein
MPESLTYNDVVPLSALCVGMTVAPSFQAQAHMRKWARGQGRVSQSIFLGMVQVLQMATI